MNNKLITLIVSGFLIIALATIFLRNEPLFVRQTNKVNVLQNIEQSNNHVKAIKLMQEAAIEHSLESNTVFTVFAPTDEAFASLPSSTLSNLTTNSDEAIHTANNHLVLGDYPTSSFNDGMILTTVNAEQIKITKRNNTWYVNDAEIVDENIHSKNGVVHSINKVLLPTK